MVNSVTTKRSPIVLIRTLVVIEGVVIALYLFGTTLDSYKYQLYAQLPFSESFTYQSLKLLLLPLAQLFITIYAFLSWYRETYSIEPSVITHSWGVLYKKEKIINFKEGAIITASISPLGKLLHYGSLYIENSTTKNALIINTISKPKLFLQTIQQAIEGNLAHSFEAQNIIKKSFDEKPSIIKLLSNDENDELEFKSSLRFDHKTGKINRDLEKTAMKTIAGFLNSKGGYLVIGINNEKKLVGLNADYPHLQHPNADGFENHLTQVFNSMIGPEFRHLISASFHQIDGVEVCVVQSLESNRPVYLKIDGDEKFYIRTGNTTTLLKLSEIEAYNQSRFPRHTTNI